MALSTFGVSLKIGATAEAATKLVDIKDFPDLWGEPNLLETTTLSDAAVTNIPGIKSSDLMSFTCNYTSADFTTVNEAANKEQYYVLEFSDGSKFTWQGQHTVGVPGKGVDEVIEFQIHVVPATAVEFSAN